MENPSSKYAVMKGNVSANRMQKRYALTVILAFSYTNFVSGLCHWSCESDKLVIKLEWKTTRWLYCTQICQFWETGICAVDCRSRCRQAISPNVYGQASSCTSRTTGTHCTHFVCISVRLWPCLLPYEMPAIYSLVEEGQNLRHLLHP